MIRATKILSLLGLLAAIAACGSIRQPVYQAPQREGNAIVEFSQDGMYLFQLFGNATQCSDPVLLPPANQFIHQVGAPLVVEAEKELAFMGFAHPQGGLQSGTRCDIIVSFKPQRNARYKAIFKDEGAACGWAVFKVEDTDGVTRLTPEPSLRKRVQRSMWTGALCEAP